jgi:hypothetical protein
VAQRTRVAAVITAVLTFGGLIAIANDVPDLLDRISGGEQAASGGPPASPDKPATAPVTTVPATTTDAPPPADTPTDETTEPVEPAGPPPVTTNAAPRPARGGALIAQIRMGSGGKIGPAEYRAGSAPGANVDVFDDYGQLSAGCYPSWVLTREGVAVRTVRNGRCTSGGITMFNFGDSLDPPGNYRLSVSVMTDGGQRGSSSVDFLVS